MTSKMIAKQRWGIVLSVITLVGLTVAGCEAYLTPIPTGDNWAPDRTPQGSAQEIYATQIAVGVEAIQAHQATATILAENYYATITADQARLEQQRLAEAQQAAAATATAQAAGAAIIATATERAYQATATQQAVAFAATATRSAEEAQTTAIADRAEAVETEYQAEAIRQMQRDEKALSYWRNYGFPAVLVVLLGSILVLAASILRPVMDQARTIRDAPPPPLAMEEEEGEETSVELRPIPLPMPSATGLRSVRILRGLDQARRAGFLSDTLLDSLEAAWRRIEEGSQ